MRQLALADAAVPCIGQGTWHMGESPRTHAAEVEALRLGISLGMTLIDTAEFYAAGGAERVVADAVADCRERVFLVGKVWPSRAGHREAQASVRESLRRLRTEWLDAVLLHWPTTSVPVAETLRAFAELQGLGVVRHFGVSNFDAARLRAAEGALPPGRRLAFDQVPYSLWDRRVEGGLLPLCGERGTLLMAYSPLGHGRMPGGAPGAALAALAADRGVTPQQAALAFVTSRPGVLAIPKAVRPEHVRANAAAGGIVLSPGERARLEAAFPPGRRTALGVLPGSTTFFRLVLGAMRLRYGRR